MGFKLKDDLQVVRTDLDRRLANFERRFADRMFSLFDDNYPHVWRFKAQLARQGKAGETAAENDCVVTLVWSRRGRHAQILARDRFPDFPHGHFLLGARTCLRR